MIHSSQLKNVSPSENLKHIPRITSSYTHSFYDELVKMVNFFDFNHRMFTLINNNTRKKRNRSAGSVQALICQLAMQDPNFREKLRTYMVDCGKDWTFTSHYHDRM